MANRLPLNTVLQSVVADDAELANAAKALAVRAIALANQYLDNGSPQMQLKVIQALMPAIARGMNDKGESEQMALLRGELAMLHEAVLGQSVA